MAGWGVMDFAGGIVVHATAGTAALVCAVMVGKRRHFPQSQIPPHSPALTMIGASMLWGRLVRLQRRFGARRRRRCRHGAAGHPYRRCHGLAGMDGH